MKSGHRSSGYALGSVESPEGPQRSGGAGGLTRRSPGREELSWPEGDFRPSRTGNDHLHHPNQAASWRRSAAPCPLDVRAEFHYRSLLFPTLNLAFKWSNEPGPPHEKNSTVRFLGKVSASGHCSRCLPPGMPR